ncbi:MAG: hypothetical protein ABH871_07025 [Pseudomonadota bacterium]
MKQKTPDMEETKEHILTAGKELLLAADGALRFCKSYAETMSAPSSRSLLVGFFSKAISVADELGKDLVRATGVTKAARSAVSPIFDALSREMEETERIKRSQRTARAPAKPRKRVAKKKTSGRARAKRR